MNKYFKLPVLSRTIAYIIFRDGRNNGVRYRTLKERFERFDEKTIKTSLESLMTQSPPLLVFDDKNKSYRASPELETALNMLRSFT